jgi:hypothetical protein
VSYFCEIFVTFNTGLTHSVVVKVLCYKPEGRGFDTQWGDFFKVHSSTLGPGVHSASNRNEYQKHKNNNVSGE